MPTQQQRERLRADLDASDDTLSDAEIDDAFARAEARYGENFGAVEAGARIVAIQQLLAAAAKRADYSQNASAEKRSQVFDHLLRLRALYAGEVSAALGTSVQWAALRRTGLRVEEYPDA